MEDFRSKSCGDGRMQMESYHGGGGGPTSTGMQDLRCYSASYAYPPQAQMGNDPKFKKGKSTNGSLSKAWSFSDPELQRKKRVASYKVYAVEGKMKGSLKKSFRWLKDRLWLLGLNWNWKWKWRPQFRIQSFGCYVQNLILPVSSCALFAS
ncbi:hypothetical protein CK203_072346 [Vitis vinifera]|uniref:DUF3511 domain protein n=1 Tax=Vitis vinifera TaxID=29760 RepID=A0A438E8K7_VITVI|nr:hypothetical protein CK203_072346 [Vitis vinifera]